MTEKRKSLAEQGNLFDKVFRTRSGEVVLAEVPNAPLVVAMVAFLLRLFTSGSTSRFFDLIFFGAIFTWGWLELTSGVSIFRRVLGGVIMLGVVWTRLWS